MLQSLALLLNAQNKEAEINEQLEKAIGEFYKPFEEQDFSNTVKILEKLKEEDPENTEIRYFLGYAYDRCNNKDASNIPNTNILLTELASKEFEYIINKEPKYDKQKLYLDPYSKITSIWGGLAYKYFYDEKLDSMRYALLEGEKRGGFKKNLLDIAENTLKSCSKNSILFVSGDNFAFPILYMQQIKGYRKDIQIIEISLLNTKWYCSLLQKNAEIHFLRKSIQYNDIPIYAESSKQTITIPTINCEDINSKFIWEIKDLRYETYIYKGDSILKEILIRNAFKNDVYFTVGQIDILSLNDYLLPGVLVNKIETCELNRFEDLEKQLNNINFESIADESTKNYDDVLMMIDFYRMAYCTLITEKLDNNKMTEAKMLIETMQKNLPEQYAPISSEEFKNEYDTFLEEAKKRIELYDSK